MLVGSTSRRTWSDGLAQRCLAVGITLALLGIAVLWRIERVGVGLSGLVFAGQQSLDDAGLVPPDELRVAVEGQGYDGAVFYFMALDPFSTESIVGLREPGYRQQRILFPLVAWAVHQTFPMSALTALLAVNLMAAAVMTWLATGLAMDLGRSPLLGALAGLSPPMIVGTLWDTAEPMALTLMLAGIVAATRYRPVLAAAAFSAAVLARETTLVAPLGIALWQLAMVMKGRRTPRWLVLAAVLPIGVFVVWQVALTAVWGAPPAIQGGSGRVGLPILGVVESLLSLRPDPRITTGSPFPELWWVGRLLLAASIGAAGIVIARNSLRPRNHPRPGPLAAMYLTAAVPAFGTGPWLWTHQYARSTAEIALISILAFLAYRGPLARAGAYAMVLLAALTMLL